MNLFFFISFAFAPACSVAVMTGAVWLGLAPESTKPGLISMKAFSRSLVSYSRRAGCSFS